MDDLDEYRHLPVVMPKSGNCRSRSIASKIGRHRAGGLLRGLARSQKGPAIRSTSAQRVAEKRTIIQSRAEMERGSFFRPYPKLANPTPLSSFSGKPPYGCLENSSSRRRSSAISGNPPNRQLNRASATDSEETAATFLARRSAAIFGQGALVGLPASISRVRRINVSSCKDSSDDPGLSSERCAARATISHWYP